MKIDPRRCFWLCTGLVLLILCGSTISWARQANLGPYSSIVAKDPFDPDRGRKQGSGASFDASPESDIEGRYQVYGTIIMGGQGKAFIKEVSSGSPMARNRRGKTASEMRSVVVGDMIDGWEVKEITEKGVVLQADGKQAVLGLFDSEKKERQARAPVALQTPQLKSPQISAPVAVKTARPAHKKDARAVQTRSKKGGQTKPPGISVPVGGKRESPKSSAEKAAPPPLPPNIGGPKIKKPAKTSGSTGQAAPSAPATNPFLEMIRQYQGGE